jgi:hypothetical protein
MVTMTEVTLTTPERPKRRSNGAAHGPVLVSGAKLATHFGVSRQHVERLTAAGVIERRVRAAARWWSPTLFRKAFYIKGDDDLRRVSFAYAFQVFQPTF